MSEVFIVIMHAIDESDEILHVCLTETRANEIAEGERLDCDYEISVQRYPITV